MERHAKLTPLAVWGWTRGPPAQVKEAGWSAASSRATWYDCTGHSWAKDWACPAQKRELHELQRITLSPSVLRTRARQLGAQREDHLAAVSEKMLSSATVGWLAALGHSMQ